MRDFWDAAPFLALIFCSTILLYGLGVLIREDIKQSQARYEQCIAAGMQWANGSCVK